MLAPLDKDRATARVRETDVAAVLEMNYCPRCAQPLQDRLAFGRTRRVCVTCDFVFFREHKVAAAAIVAREGQVLLVRRTMSPGQGKWMIPGGFVEFDEDPRQAVEREVLEETGYKVKATQLLDVIFGQEHPRGASLLILYLARFVDDKPASGMDQGEVDAVAFFPPDQLPPVAFKTTQRVIELWKSNK
jgi:ADP-ribose pyrophosphatase YjhB (NUDIX family)